MRTARAAAAKSYDFNGDGHRDLAIGAQSTTVGSATGIPGYGTALSGWPPRSIPMRRRTSAAVAASLPAAGLTPLVLGAPASAAVAKHYDDFNGDGSPDLHPS
ncbi:FG-GAP repeat protein [Streptomyces sp. 142MFCol3.1]|uniref:FG-GAP repeat protein n=1 Tax=Streptomyces sp. 142MFCol3.1 TaxID=1172179 RepID=UPI00041C0719|nr:FG-GAP repeat protein [Streptomyces sp. 142MFCol3.1]